MTLQIDRQKRACQKHQFSAAFPHRQLETRTASVLIHCGRADCRVVICRSSGARLASIRRPASRRAASLNRGPTSCRLVTGTILSCTGIGIASAGFPAKFTATVFCMTSTRASKRAIFHNVSHVFANRSDGIQMPWFNRKYTLGGNKAKSRLQTNHSAASRWHADGTGGICSKGHVGGSIGDRHR